jgi:hypothetical protein
VPSVNCASYRGYEKWCSKSSRQTTTLVYNVASSALCMVNMTRMVKMVNTVNVVKMVNTVNVVKMVNTVSVVNMVNTIKMVNMVQMVNMVKMANHTVQSAIVSTTENASRHC